MPRRKSPESAEWNWKDPESINPKDSKGKEAAEITERNFIPNAMEVYIM
jgi:hypothetical protein